MRVLSFQQQIVHLHSKAVAYCPQTLDLFLHPHALGHDRHILFKLQRCQACCQRLELRSDPLVFRDEEFMSVANVGVNSAVASFQSMQFILAVRIISQY